MGVACLLGCKEELCMAIRWELSVKFLEQGNIFFFYKPKKGVEEVKEFEDVGRFYFVLDPYGEKQIRFVVMGQKKMPSVTDGHERAWGFIEKVGGRGFMVSSKQKVVSVSGNARPVGEGLYAILHHIDHTHLVYVLELPRKLGEVQKAFNIERQANYIFIIKHPNTPLPPGALLPSSKGEPKNENFIKEFGTRKYIPVNPPSLLDYEGAMVFMIGVNDELAKLGMQVNKDIETEGSADIFQELKMSKKRHPIEPLMKGTWK